MQSNKKMMTFSAREKNTKTNKMITKQQKIMKGKNLEMKSPINTERIAQKKIKMSLMIQMKPRSYLEANPCRNDKNVAYNLTVNYLISN